MSKRGKAIGSYFTMEITQRINLEYLKAIVSNKMRLRIRDKVEIKVTKDNNRNKATHLASIKLHLKLAKIFNK